MKRQILLLLLFVMIICASGRMSRHCRLGEYLYAESADNEKYGMCRKCPVGYYNDRFHHRSSHCFKCTSFDERDPHKVLVKNCNRFEDTQIRCKDNFFYVQDRERGHCKHCTPFDEYDPYKILLKKCNHFHDTQIRCVDNFFYVQDREGGQCELCTPFDKNDPHKILVKNCSPFEDAQIRCVDNFFYVKDREGGRCEPCTNCTLRHQYWGQTCSDYSDAICCDKKGSIVKNGVCEKFVD
ncbi:src kinase signaling inhibitor 1 [Plakobranchus ocellatus]|uniref:Src kinase signaling inhibitor 1 n=1 Tax=Plakobranchus ocellatus TaxID=259542 RepID=A0AAV3YUA6_9GAST|nr:src kinase signaling inhibitor 1 [Plakobranchus ocellatus]